MLKVALQFQSDGLLKHLWLLNRVQIALHQGSNSLPHSLLAHLEGVADLDLFNARQRVLPGDRLSWLQSPDAVVVL